MVTKSGKMKIFLQIISANYFYNISKIFLQYFYNKNGDNEWKNENISKNYDKW